MLTARTHLCMAVACLMAGSTATAASGMVTLQTPADPAAPVPGPLLSEASAALAGGDASRALQIATSYLERHPRDVGALVLIVRAHVQRQDWDNAYRVVSRAARDHPADLDVLYYVGLVTRRLASDQFERLVKMAPQSARVHQVQAEVFEAQERRADAEREYRAALAAQPDLLEALLGLAKLERIRLACTEAIDHYRKAEAIRPTFDAAYGIGVCRAQMHDDANAVSDFERAVERDPSAGVAWAWLGTSLVKLGRTARGIEVLERAVALEPEMSEAHYVLGMAYRTSGDAARAKAAFERVEQLRARSRP